MAPIDFYHLPESPPCCAVEMVAGMVGVELTKHHVNLFAKDHLKEDYIRLYPLHKVPFIVDGELRMGESRAIMMYLVNKYKPDDEHLYPSDPNKRALVDELLFYDMGLFSALVRLLEPKMFGPVKELNVEDEKAFRDYLSHLDKKLGESSAQNFMLGNHLTIGDVSMAATFLFADECDYSLSEFKHLVAYLERLKSAIPKYSAINNAPVENMKRYIRSKQGVV